jgi:hypothetical protein
MRYRSQKTRCLEREREREREFVPFNIGALGRLNLGSGQLVHPTLATWRNPRVPKSLP